jgi:hypothetical protein
MKYLGDYAEDYTALNTGFNTHKADGTPIALVSGAVCVYKANSITQSTAGITLATDFNSIVGLNNILVDLSTDSFYTTANDYKIVLNSGIVDSKSVAGTIIAEFSIQNRFNVSATSIRTEIDNNSVQLSGIVADTNELQTDFHTGGRLDIKLDEAKNTGVLKVWNGTGWV